MILAPLELIFLLTGKVGQLMACWMFQWHGEPDNLCHTTSLGSDQWTEVKVPTSLTSSFVADAGKWQNQCTMGLGGKYFLMGGDDGNL